MIDPKIQAQIDALEAAFMQARGGGEDFRTALPNLSPELLDYILKSQAQDHGSGNGMYRGISDPSGAGFYQFGGYSELNPNASPEASARDTGRVDWSQSPLQFSVNSDTSNYLANYDQQGRFTGYEIAQDDNNWRDAIIAAMMLAPAAYAAVGAAGSTAGTAGAGGGAAGGGGAGGGAAGSAYGAGGQMLLPTTAEMAAGVAPASVNTALASLAPLSIAPAATTSALTSATAKAAATTAATQAANQGGGDSYDDFRAQERGGYQSDPNVTTKPATTGGNMTDFDRWWEGAKQAIGSGAGSDPASWANVASNFLGNNAGGLLGAYLGYQDSKDKENTSKTEPWGPAQPYLKGLLSEGADLYGQYKGQPFSPTEQTAYGNLGNVFDFINANAGGLMSGFDATAAGKNQFSRNNPRKGLIGNSYDAATSPVTWAPGLLGSFGTRKG